MEPDHQGFVDHHGTKIGYEVFGDGGPTILLMPTWTIVHSRFWKAQVPYLARHHRVVTFDGPGNGRSDRPVDSEPYSVEAVVGQTMAVLDATGTDSAIVVGLSRASEWMLALAGAHPGRLGGMAFIGPALDLTDQAPERADIPRTFREQLDDPQGWEKYNAHHWTEHWTDFAEFFFAESFNEPHSTKQREDALGWSLETTPQVLIAEALAPSPSRAELEELARQVTCPVLAIHGTDDRISPVSRSERLVELTGGELVLLEGSGHLPLARDPVRVNLVLRDFVQRIQGARPRPTTTWTRGRSRRKRALWISSPIGLGHARRDVATAQALRELHPDLEIDWLAQHPVTRLLADVGERVHPASEHLASESAHIESEAGEHSLHCFQAWRRMDEILVADFMVFHDVVTSQDYDLVVGDEAWDVDYFLHENPELKRFAYAWATDFVGWLPVDGADARERRLTADYNAEMIEHIARYPRVRDAALFVGDPEDIVDERFGPDLPMIREWTEANYTFPGYITGFDPAAIGDRDEVRDELGYAPDEQVCVVTVGGSGVGGDLLDRVVTSFDEAKRRVPALRMVVVAGPRIDPDRFARREGLEVRGYVPELHRHLAVCDLAIVQGGLTTCMELTASGRPFVYVPLRDHFEQQHHVHHRLRRHGAGIRMDYADASPDALAETIARQVGSRVDYLPVPTDGAARAAETLAALL